MRRIVLPIVVLLLFVSESIFVDISPVGHLNTDYVFVPRFLMIIFVFIAVYTDRYQGMLYGFIYGLLFDIVYTGIIGVYMFGMSFIAYLMAKASKALLSNIFVTSLLGVVAVVILEFYVYIINFLIGYTDMQFMMFLQNRLLPTVILNSIFVLLIAFPIKKLITWLSVVE